MENTKTKISLFTIGLMVVFAVITLTSIGSSSNFISMNTSTGANLNGTVFNTTTPSILVFCAGNATFWNATIRNSTGGQNLGSATVANGTGTSITMSTLTARSYYSLNLSCYNSTAGSFFNETIIMIDINGQPSISNTGTGPGVILKGQNRTFVVNWSDVATNLSAGDNVDSATLYVCRSSGFGTNCTGNSWCQSALDTQDDNSTTCSFNIGANQPAGTQDYVSYIVDVYGYVSASSSGTFVTASSSGEDEVYVVTTTPSKSISEKEIAGIKLPLIALIATILIIAVIIVALSKRR